MEILVLGRKELEKLLDMKNVIDGVKDVYKLKASDKTVVWPLIAYDFNEQEAVMDIRSGYVMEENLHGLKMLNNFPHNKEKNLPSFNGMLIIFDSTTGIPLGVMDAAYITCMRTGAASAIASQTLARADSKTLFVLGAGKQAIYQIAATLFLLPRIKKVHIADIFDLENAKKLANSCPKTLKEKFNIDSTRVEFNAVRDIEKAVEESDIIITITPARSPAILKEWVKPGTHFSCIGADMEGKEEIDPKLFCTAKVYADDISQCMRVGEMELPIKQRIINKSDLVGEIGQVLTGLVPGRTSNDEITIFDATGLALLDLVTGKKAIDAAKKSKIGTIVEI